MVLEKSREPIALHWPVIELAPVPGRPMLPVMSARLMIACAVCHPLMALVDSHRPPERDAGALVDSPRRIADRRGAQACLVGHPLHIEPADKGGEFVEAVRVGVDERPVDPSVLDQHVRQAIKEHEVRLGPHRAGAAKRPSPSRSAGDRRR